MLDLVTAVRERSAQAHQLTVSVMQPVTLLETAAMI